MLGADSVWSLHDFVAFGGELCMWEIILGSLVQRFLEGFACASARRGCVAFCALLGRWCGGEGKPLQPLISGCSPLRKNNNKLFRLLSLWHLASSRFSKWFGHGRTVVTHTLRGYRGSGACWRFSLSGSLFLFLLTPTLTLLLKENRFCRKKQVKISVKSVCLQMVNQIFFSLFRGFFFFPLKVPR